ncbi:MAG: hypothetical protein CSB44_13020 [Gammaproteobacteria bacterium]|nr:MAG: hypothetical protein CSB44_13020 [Gammaproteobacteria bacterium]
MSRTPPKPDDRRRERAHRTGGELRSLAKPWRLEALEPRLLFSADVPFLADVLGSGTQVGSNPVGRVAEGSLPVAMDLRASDALAFDARTSDMLVSEDAATAHDRQGMILVIIDSAVDDVEGIVADIASRDDPNLLVHVLGAESTSDRNGSPIEQLDSIVSNYSDIAELHLISHAGEGSLTLSGTELGLVDVLAEADRLANWQDNFTAEADFLIYGCDLAATESGRNLVDTLAALTGTDVAASVDLTGNGRVGGDWSLEYRHGDVAGEVLLSDTLRESYAGTLATFTVSNLNDHGAGSFRQAIIDANDTTGATHLIEFDVAGVINLDSILPVISKAVVIDATTAPGFAGIPVVTIDGSVAGYGNGLQLSTGSDGSTVRGLGILNFERDGIMIVSSHNTIAQNHVGSLVSSVGDGNGRSGVYIYEGSNNTIGGALGGNLLSGNGDAGVRVEGAGASNNQIIGNLVGTDHDGTAAVPNAQRGIIVNANDGTVIHGNVISGNGTSASGRGDGIMVLGSSNGTRITGNFIGTDHSGTAAIGNIRHGVVLYNGATNTIIGSNMTGERNVIAGNGGNGISINNEGVATSNHTIIEGNFIGIDVTGRAALGNGHNGIGVGNGALNTSIRGGNAIAANGANGVQVGGLDTQDTEIQSNYIGIAIDGVTALPNVLSGIKVQQVAVNTYIGGELGNLISGNLGHGIEITGGGVTNTTVVGNTIGLSSNGGQGVGNGLAGVRIGEGSQGNTIGSTEIDFGNTISGNGGDGVLITGAATSHNTLVANFIGTARNGSTEIGNGGHGVFIDGAQNITVGGASDAERNVVSGNGGSGIVISGANSMGNSVTGNYIGTDASGVLALGNAQHGVLLSASASINVIGGSSMSGMGNVISANGGNGIDIQDNAFRNTIIGNTVGLGRDGAVIGNATGGVRLDGPDNILGDGIAGHGNVISGNNGHGVLVDVNAMGTRILGNRIGMDSSGSQVRGNQWHGILVQANDVTIGGTTAETRNVVSGNGASGIVIDHASSVSVYGNHIGTSFTGDADVGNGGHGISVQESADNIIGGQNAGEGNVVSGNAHGIVIHGTASTGNDIVGNRVGVGADGNVAIGNGNDGIVIEAGASNNVVGGTNAGSANVISDNGGAGVRIDDTGENGTRNNIVVGNAIGTDISGVISLGNGTHGILILSAANNLIGGVAVGSGNTVAYNGASGVNIRGTSATGNTILGNVFRQNTDLAIDLEPAAVTVNDLGDADVGPNNLQNHPIINEAWETSDGKLYLSGTLNSAANSHYRIEFYLSQASDPAGHGEGERLFHSITVITDASGNATFSEAVTTSFNIGEVVTATATEHLISGTYGDSSEFSAAAAVTTAPDLYDVSPVLDSDVSENSVSEAAGVGTGVGVTAEADDADLDDSVSYSLTDDAGGLFAIDADTGVVTVAGALDHETAASHQIEVQAQSSDSSISTQVFTIQVKDVDEFDVTAVTDSDGASDAVNENSAIGTVVGITATASDPDGSDTVTYSLTDDAGGLFSIDETTGVVTVAGALDHETAASHQIEVQAKSTDGSISTQVFSIQVKDVDEFDVTAISDIDGTADAVAENVAVGTVVGITASAADGDAGDNVSYSLTDDAGGLFAIDATTGVVTVVGALDHEAAASHQIEVQAQSSDGSTSTRVFSIQVKDVDEFDVTVISDSDGTADAVNENAVIGTVVGITASASDPDGSDTVSYSLTDDAGGLFAIDGTTGVVTVAGALDHEAAASHQIEVQAQSSDGSTSTRVFSIQVGDVDEFDVTAVTDSDGASDAVAENAAIGTVVGITASATDNDAGDTVAYSLTDDADGLFAIDADTGVVTVAGTLDHEAAASHQIEVEAQSSDGSTSTQVFSIQVKDVDEFDVTAVTDSDGASDAVNENAAIGTVVGITATASDPDGSDTVTYSLTDIRSRCRRSPRMVRRRPSVSRYRLPTSTSTLSRRSATLTALPMQWPRMPPSARWSASRPRLRMVMLVTMSATA